MIRTCATLSLLLFVASAVGQQPITSRPVTDTFDPKWAQAAPSPSDTSTESQLIRKDIEDENRIRDLFGKRIRASIASSNFGFPPEQTRRIESKRNRMLRKWDRNRWARDRSIDVAMSRALGEGLLDPDDLLNGDIPFSDETNERDWASFFEQLIAFIERLIALFSSLSSVDTVPLRMAA